MNNMEKEKVKIGDMVANQAKPEKCYTITQIDIDGINAICVDENNKPHTIPLIALVPCAEKKATIKARSVW